MILSRLFTAFSSLIQPLFQLTDLFLLLFDRFIHLDHVKVFPSELPGTNDLLLDLFVPSVEGHWSKVE